MPEIKFIISSLPSRRLRCWAKHPAPWYIHFKVSDFFAKHSVFDQRGVTFHRCKLPSQRMTRKPSFCIYEFIGFQVSKNKKWNPRFINSRWIRTSNETVVESFCSFPHLSIPRSLIASGESPHSWSPKLLVLGKNLGHQPLVVCACASLLSTNVSLPVCPHGCCVSHKLHCAK